MAPHGAARAGGKVLPELLPSGERVHLPKSADRAGAATAAGGGGESGTQEREKREAERGGGNPGGGQGGSEGHRQGSGF